MTAPRDASALSPRKRQAILQNLRKAWEARRQRRSRMTERRLEACRANIRQAHAALRRQGWRRTEKRLAACRANIRKAHEANRTRPLSAARRAALRKATEANWRKFRMTDARRVANRAKLAKAWTTLRPKESYMRSRFNRLKHGIRLRKLEEALPVLGESPEELQAHLRLLERTFAPRDAEERRLVRRIGKATWLRFCMYRAEARRAAARLRQRLWCLPFDEEVDAEETSDRAYEVMDALLADDRVLELDDQILKEIDRSLNALVRMRKGSDVEFAADTQGLDEHPEVAPEAGPSPPSPADLGAECEAPPEETEWE